MNAELIHNLIFYVMYASLVVLAVIFIERVIYFSWTLKQSKKLKDQLQRDAKIDEQQVDKKDKNPAYALIQPLLTTHFSSENEKSDVIEQQYLQSKGTLNKGIWILETIVTAAPLLGLLGTILGIVDTFHALAASGTSDASKVSGGMGTALYATGLGIAIALIALIANNFLGSRIEKINELSKILLIQVSKEKKLAKPEVVNEKRYA
ncbi:MotA/TolQ/ExbB proton channel family protein [Acinetobacter pollinis]|uniref:MotA/TolQ/ExbB proton channel family protein n=1 Tax=Acinetobacter pollinis TaxID=2605270 RepID=A0ABU6DSP6_9GAMM|nr:MotA/TolQ/ExbB proton channel family protein [Acinetobacter pollinis]MEB5476876.1 MotA/TolQ/ExbB proton channel family protein [Acinetobacter pollinis]